MRMVANGRLPEAARRKAARTRHRREEGEVPMARRLAQIGVLGWLIALPTLGGAWLGRWVDGLLGSGVAATAPLMLVGLCLGCWIGWRWVGRA